MTKPCVIITGPTASGKSNFAEQLACLLPGFIINADMAQCYTPLTIGTAKPDLSVTSIPHYLFNILSTPRDFSVMEYRKQVFDIIKDQATLPSIPFIVGGSLFYIKSLFFPPQELQTMNAKTRTSLEEICHDDTKTTQELWEYLKKIDPSRAKAIFPTDRYRIVRALEIWYKTGILPSSLQPQFMPPQSPVVFVVLLPPRDMLKKRITIRTQEIFDAWIEETRAIQDLSWRTFIERKRFIGYSELFAWLDRGAPTQEREKVIDTIITKTMQYAKRQETFWKSFEKQLTIAYQPYQYPCAIKTYTTGTKDALQEIKAIINSFNHST